MNYMSIIKGLLGHHKPVCESGIAAKQNQIHVTIDGKLDDLTSAILDQDPLELVMLDSDFSLPDLLDRSNVEHDGFNPYGALHYPTDWKLIELIIDTDGMVLLVFMDQRSESCQMDDQGKILQYESEVVPFGNFSEHFIFMVDAMNHSWQYIVMQEFDDQVHRPVTTILEIHDGCKLAMYTPYYDNSSESLRWHVTHYATESLDPNLVRPLLWLQEE